MSQIPVVLVSGQLLTVETWQPQVRAWQPTRDVLIADHCSDDSIAGMATRLLLAAPPSFDLVAHAMGGFVAFEVMRRAPERVRRLVLVATLASADGPAQTARRQGYIELVEQGRFSDVIEERIPMLFPPDRRDDPALLGLARRMASETGPDTFLRQQRAIMARVDSRPMLGAITAPTMLLWGDADGITTRAQQDEMLAAIPAAQLTVVPGAGHLPTREAERLTTAMLTGWLDGD